MSAAPVDQFTVLIVDDEPANIILLERILKRSAGIRCKNTTDSRAALPLYLRYQPDLVLLDLHMPFLDGFAVMAQLKAAAAEQKRHLPVLVLTADASIDTKRRALSSGASDFLTKPLDHFETVLRVKNLLETSSLHRVLREQNENLEQAVTARTKDYQDALTQLRETQQQVIRQERLSALGTMASGIAHDFNNALTMVIGYSELLLADAKKKLNEEEFDCLARILQAGKDAGKIVERLREFYRPTDEKEPRTSVDLNAVAAQAVNLTAPKWREQTRAAGIRLEVETDLGKIAPISGNAAELREILANLIFNAVDAMPRGGTIRVSTRSDGSGVLLVVGDDGEGMPENVRQHCFEPFFTTKGDKGTGLGLSAVYGIVQRHEGRIEVESEPGKGTSFTIRFPISLAVRGQAATEETAVISSPLRILLVDDQEDVREVLVSQLVLEGHITDSAPDGLTALQKFATNIYDVIITDKAMPGMSGEQLAGAIKRRSPKTPVVLLTGFDGNTCQGDLASRDVDVFVGKPATTVELREALIEATSLAAPIAA